MSDKKHPGWAVQFDDGTWLGRGHGFIKTSDAALAYRYTSVRLAQNDFTEFATENNSVVWKHTILPAWEPLCEQLRLEVQELKSSNSIDGFELWMQVESIKSAVKEIERMNNFYLSPTNKVDE